MTETTPVEALVDAFKQGVTNFFYTRGDSRIIPTDDEIRDAAAKVLQQEEKDSKLRIEALQSTIEIDCRMFGEYREKYYPPARECPLSFSRYSWLGGAYFLDDTEMSMEEALRHCLSDTFFEWYRSKRTAISYELDKNLTKEQVKRLEKEFANSKSKNSVLVVHNVLDDGSILRETMKWDGNLVSEEVLPPRK